MKHFTAFFLTIVLCICCLVPVSARAAEFQVTYSSDLGISDYKYFFICLNQSDNCYYLFCLNDRVNSLSNGIQFVVNADSSQSKLKGGTSGDTATYTYCWFKYNSDTNTFGNKSTSGNTTMSGWDFYNSGSGRKILAANADIYDQEGYKILSGDYENFLSYFTNPEQIQHVVNNYVPEEPTSEGGSSGESGGLINIDFSGITSTFTNLITPIQLKLADIYNILLDIKQIVNERIYLKIIHINELQREVEKVTDKLDDVVTALGSTAIVDKLDSISYDIISKLDSIQINELTAIKNKLDDIKNILNVFEIKFTNFTDIGNSSIRTIVDSIETAETTIATDLVQFQSAVTNKFVDVLNILDTIGGSVLSIESYVKYISDISGHVSSIDVYFKSFYENFTGSFTNTINSILNAICSLPSLIYEDLKYLFIPQNDDYFKDIIDTINAKFGFIHQFIELGDVLVDNSGSFTNTPPNFTIELKDNKYFGTVTFNLVDWSRVSDYIPYVKALISGITLYLFIRRTRKKLPEVISGGGC